MEVALAGARLRGLDLDLPGGVLRGVGAVDPVAVQDHPEGLRAPRHGRRDAGGEAGWRHLQAALALRAADQDAVVTIQRTEVETALTVDDLSLVLREGFDLGATVCVEQEVMTGEVLPGPVG